MPLSYAPASGVGSNKVVANPGSGGVVQRRARRGRRDCTLPAAAQIVERPACTLRWLAPSAKAKAELDQDSPSARKASTDACFSATGRASTTTSAAARGVSAKAVPGRCDKPPEGAGTARKPPHLHPQPGAVRVIGAPGAEGPRHQRVPRDVAWPGLTQRPGPGANSMGRSRQRDGLARSTHSIAAGIDHQCRRGLARPPHRRGRSSRSSHTQPDAPPAHSRAVVARSTSAISPGIRDASAARLARTSAARAGLVWRRAHRDPRRHQFMRGAQGGRQAAPDPVRPIRVSASSR